MLAPISAPSEAPEDGGGSRGATWWVGWSPVISLRKPKRSLSESSAVTSPGRGRRGWVGGRVWEGCFCSTLAVGYAPWRGGHLWGPLLPWKPPALSPEGCEEGLMGRGGVFGLTAVTSHELRVPRRRDCDPSWEAG